MIGFYVTVVQNEVQVKKNISLAVHTSFESSVRYDSETVDEKIWHWDLLVSWKNMAFLEFFWPFWVFLGAIFTQPCCFRVFLALDMTSTHPRHLPDTLRHHPETARHPQSPSRHPSDTPVFGLHAATGRQSNI